MSGDSIRMLVGSIYVIASIGALLYGSVAISPVEGERFVSSRGKRTIALLAVGAGLSVAAEWILSPTVIGIEFGSPLICHHLAFLCWGGRRFWCN